MRLALEAEELNLLAWNVSNEIINGFKIDRFHESIGISIDEFKSLAIRLRSATTDATLSSREARVFGKALALVIDELGVEEFQTRTGHEFEEGSRLLQKLSSYLAEDF